MHGSRCAFCTKANELIGKHVVANDKTAQELYAMQHCRVITIEQFDKLIKAYNKKRGPDPDNLKEVSNHALLKMRKAHEAGKGCYLTKRELEAFSVETIGEWWSSIEDNGHNMAEDEIV